MYGNYFLDSLPLTHTPTHTHTHKHAYAYTRTRTRTRKLACTRLVFLHWDPSRSLKSQFIIFMNLLEKLKTRKSIVI